MLYNLHTHTYRCNHAQGEDREYVENAIKSGIKVLGFSDHCPQFFPDKDYYSYFRMKPELTEDYVNSVLSLKKEYADDIKILLGFETEYYPKTFDKLMDFFSGFPIDYLIMGQHFVGNEYDGTEYYAVNENHDSLLLEQYVNQVEEGIKKGVFTYIAHPDIMNFSGDMEFYRTTMTRLCRIAKKEDIPLEYNLLGYVNRKCYPNPEFWKIAKAEGNKVTIGFDAHTPNALLRFDVYRDRADYLNSLGITPMEFEDITIRKPKL